MEVTAACVPVTALHVYHLNDRALLLSGQGSTIVAHDDETKKIIFTRRVFGSQVIHGISTKSEPMTGSGETVIQIRLWAGNAAALLRLRGFKESIRDTITLELMNLHVIGLCDWAFFGDFFEFEPRELEQPYIVTAHNEVYKIALHRHPVTESSTESCEKLVSGPRSVLYSAYARSTSTGLLIAAGTVFGEVVVWTANKNERSGTWTSNLLNVLLGHRGSIFGVCISENVFFAGKRQRLLATCSDDRSIRLWKINEEGSSSRLDEEGSHPIQLSDETGFGHSGNDSTSLLAMAWGHASRIWNVRFLPTDFSSETRKLMLVSTGEDASVRFWLATDNIAVDDGASRSIQLRETGYYGNHSGKNIWSSDHHSLRDRNVYYTGGADGSIVGTALESMTETKAKLGNFHTHMSFDDVFGQGKINNRPGNPSNSKATALKYYAVANDRSILATTATGELVHGKLDMARETISWQKIYDNLSRSPLLICSDRISGSIFCALPGGNLFAVGKSSENFISSSISIVQQATLLFIAPTEAQLGSQERQSSIIIPLPSESRITLITVKVSDSIRLESRIRLLLPQSFVPISGCHHVQQGLLVLGSRSGSIAIYDNLVESEPAVSVFYNIHGTDSITSFIFLHDGQFSANNPAQDLFILTTGRDGTYAVHMIGRTGSSEQAWTLQTVHRSSPPVGPNIEGAYLVTDAASQIRKLVLYGFRSKDFVVWNETEQTEVLAVDCGGAHRSWAYSPLQEDGSGNALYGGTFVWTKAGACHVYGKSCEDHYKVHDGGHGREIKALATLHPRPNSNGTVSDTSVLVATGAEDTTIRLFEINTSYSGVSQQEGKKKKFSCIRILSKHTTGIHHLEFSPCRNYLISSGGCEELFVWRLHKKVPVVGLGVVLESMLPKTDVDADARITSFRVGKQSFTTRGSIDERGMDFEISATYSNGKVKVWKYSCEHGSKKGNFDLLEEIQIGSFCLTVLENDAKDEIMLTAGTNGYLNIHFPQKWSLLWEQKVHQNSIQASLLVKLHGFSSTWLVVTGGDDNAIGLTVFCPDSVTSRRSISAFRTLLIPKAHAAAVTGLGLISQTRKTEGSCILTFASVSNDQRVKVWRILFQAKAVVAGDVEMGDVQVGKIAECWTNVADAASVEVLPSALLDRIGDTNHHGTALKSGYELLIVGVGMEILHIPVE